LITTRELLIFAKRFKLTYIKLIYYHQHNSHEEQDEEEEEETISQHSSENETVQLDRRASKTVDVQPYTTVAGKEIGLVVHNVEEGSYVDRVGELQTADRITEINGRDITSLSNTKAMEIYNEALHDEVINFFLIDKNLYKSCCYLQFRVFNEVFLLVLNMITGN